MAETREASQIAQDHSAMGDSVSLINGIIAGSSMAGEESAEKQDCVNRNVEHLEIMVAKEDWGSESMVASKKAIKDGKAYKA